MADIFELFKKITPAEPVGAPTHIIAGLGNPGDKYALTRHNAGFMALSYIAQKQNVRVDRVKFHAMLAHTEISGVHALLLAPQTFMNLSGEAVRECADFYKIPPQNIIVISDDINLDVGRIRVRQKGSDGGHNGLKNIIYQLKSEDFVRFRVGVGAPPHPDYELMDWVLAEFSREDQKVLFEVFGCVYDGICKLLAGDTDGAVRLCNSARFGAEK